MNEEIKKALEICIEDESCEGCFYVDDHDCNEHLKSAVLRLIISQEKTIAYLQDMNNKLAEELQNSMELLGNYKSKEDDDGN